MAQRDGVNVDLKKLDVDIEKWSDEMGIEVNLVVKKLAFDVFSDIVQSTPVLTGRAKNNWNISVGSVDRSTTKEGGNSASVESNQKSKAAIALAQIRTFPFGVIWISNSLPYITELNEGSSNKAPAQFVERAIANNLAAFKS